MLKPTEIISHQGLGEWVCKIVAGAYLPHPHNIFGNTIPNKSLAKRHSVLVQGDAIIIRVQNLTHIFHKYSCGFGYLDPH